MADEGETGLSPLRRSFAIATAVRGDLTSALHLSKYHLRVDIRHHSALLHCLSQCLSHHAFLGDPAHLLQSQIRQSPAFHPMPEIGHVSRYQPAAVGFEFCLEEVNHERCRRLGCRKIFTCGQNPLRPSRQHRGWNDVVLNRLCNQRSLPRLPTHFFPVSLFPFLALASSLNNYRYNSGLCTHPWERHTLFIFPARNHERSDIHPGDHQQLKYALDRLAMPQIAVVLDRPRRVTFLPCQSVVAARSLPA